ncbi:MAG: DUF5989 family protein [Rubripirellula sp.]
MTNRRHPNRGSHENQPAADSDGSVIQEFFDFLRFNKKWWLAPIVIVVLLLAAAAILSPSPVAPFIYTLF